MRSCWKHAFGMAPSGSKPGCTGRERHPRAWPEDEPTVRFQQDIISSACRWRCRAGGRPVQRKIPVRRAPDGDGVPQAASEHEEQRAASHASVVMAVVIVVVVVWCCVFVETLLMQVICDNICDLHIVKVCESEVRPPTDTPVRQLKQSHMAAKRIDRSHELEVNRVHPVPEVQPKIRVRSTWDVVPELENNRDLRQASGSRRAELACNWSYRNCQPPGGTGCRTGTERP